jgi:prevent-host-death family protein
MTTIGAFEAKTHLSALLDRVARGERITITKHGRPAAVLAPVDSFTSRRSREEVVKALRELRKRVKPAGISVREMIEQGRRF